jgi:hypothetical protein
MLSTIVKLIPQKFRYVNLYPSELLNFEQAALHYEGVSIFLIYNM